MIRSIVSILFLSVIFFLYSCQSEDQNNLNEKEYINSVKEWKTKRLMRLKSDDGWLNLVGLHWLEEGINEFGSHKENKIIFPEKAADFIGAIIKFKGNLSISINDSIEVFVNDSLITEYDIVTDENSDPTVFTMGRYNWHIINRNGKFAIRLRDIESPLIDKITEIPSYPIDPEWKIEAFFDRFDTPTELQIANVIGTTDPETCYGSLTFTIHDNQYTVYPLGDGINENLFLMLGDETSASETYGGGRYLSIEKPDKDGKTFIDFNKASNPPCAFTEFATCPLPPPENLLDIKVTAGEKMSAEFVHH